MRLIVFTLWKFLIFAFPAYNLVDIENANIWNWETTYTFTAKANENMQTIVMSYGKDALQFTQTYRAKQNWRKQNWWANAKWNWKQDATNDVRKNNNKENNKMRHKYWQTQATTGPNAKYFRRMFWYCFALAFYFDIFTISNHPSFHNYLSGLLALLSSARITANARLSNSIRNDASKATNKL